MDADFQYKAGATRASGRTGWRPLTSFPEHNSATSSHATDSPAWKAVIGSQRIHVGPSL